MALGIMSETGLFLTTKVVAWGRDKQNWLMDDIVLDHFSKPHWLQLEEVLQACSRAQLQPKQQKQRNRPCLKQMSEI